MATAVRHEGHVHIVCCSFENGDFLFHDLSEELVPLEGPPGSWKIYFDQNGLGYISSGITSIWVSTLLSEAVYQVEQEGIMKFYLKKAGVVSWLSSKFKEQARSLHILALDGATSTMVFTYFTLSIAGGVHDEGRDPDHPPPGAEANRRPILAVAGEPAGLLPAGPPGLLPEQDAAPGHLGSIAEGGDQGDQGEVSSLIGPSRRGGARPPAELQGAAVRLDADGAAATVRPVCLPACEGATAAVRPRTAREHPRRGRARYAGHA
eukprot:CAMPEP_0204606708 /NCGR_PEP_ID=MMETSP0661-20131031/59250_1 /ASSEMBLY_ACC=CAM_ASM_000606 /TAXON_ID=109239 /ORGANISM="Alexandrium margalefi, Strain AMGDE01CS-322" /LENGTH=263 /DNA_ID=CAMNT_0051618053 /DNA_START=180 /DNA_END=967 /DNA_ORIENTATION=+